MNLTNKIKVLSPQQAIKIAAGEVVERPINIIKEIIENSIDADASKISIFIHKAGKSLIKVIDNGIGMTPDDAKLSVTQHATSKINTVEDLETIATFGFRGEALASINAVSNVTINTKTADNQTATQIRWGFGTLQEETLSSHPTGTTLEISNLFDNIPARKKFLKKDETEWRAIVTLFQAFCLDYQNIHFQLHNENGLYLNCPATTNLTDRAAQLFDIHLQKKIMPLVQLDNKLCTVSGIISMPTHYRYDRNQIFIFVNNRWIKNIDLTKSIMKGYAGTLPPQKFPAAIIFITIATDQIDVNIHPKKEEIKFLHPKKVETIVINSIKATLEESVTQQLTMTPHDSTPLEHQQLEKPISNFNQDSSPKPFSFLNNSFETLTSNKLTVTKENLKTPTTNPFESVEAQSQPVAVPEFLAPTFQTPAPTPTENEPIINQQEEIETNEQLNISIIGQYKLTYILFEKDNNLVFIDQHAAHERILYERLKANFDNVPTIQLMFPAFIKLQAQDIVAITPHLTLLQTHGIHAEIFSDTQLIIQATPIHLKNHDLTEIIQQIIGWIAHIDETDEKRIAHILNEKIHTKIACSTAIKAGDKLNTQQIQQLLSDLNKIESRFSCPHGRPTFWVLPIDHLEKQFKRDYGKKSEQFYDFL